MVTTLTVLMQAGIREILIITTPKDQEQFNISWVVVPNGNQLEYKINKTRWIGKNLYSAENFLNCSPSVMI